MTTTATATTRRQRAALALLRDTTTKRPSRRALIEREYRDIDGYWIELVPGWIVADEGTHGIVEDTKRAAHAKLALVEPCACAECTELQKAVTR